MKRFLMLLTCCFVMACSMKPAHVLVVTGGHDFDEPTFFAMLDALENITYEVAEHPNALEKLQPESVKNFDAILFYDMPQEISRDEQKMFVEMAEQGKGLLFMHHSLASYDDWPEITQIRGGRYVLQPDSIGEYIVPASTYKHGLDLDVKIVDSEHPVTKGMQDFTIHDEGYNVCQIFDSVTPLLTTEHPECEHTIAWTHEYDNSTVVYLMLGHGPEAYANENLHQLLTNAIRFVTL